MPKTPGNMHMYDMLKIDAIFFEIVGWGAFKATLAVLFVAASKDMYEISKNGKRQPTLIYLYPSESDCLS